MRLKKLAATYSIFVGVSMIGMWMMFYLTGSIPELQTKPAEIAMHLFAEAVTAVTLIAAGVGVIKAKGWGVNIFFLSMGMLLYSLLNSPGYFLQNGEYGLAIMFAALVVGAVALIIAMALEEGKIAALKNKGKEI